MGLEGIVSKRLGSRYVSGRKNPAAPVVKREAEEDLGIDLGGNTWQG
jgi:ATP-dependent DNA ligase